MCDELKVKDKGRQFQGLQSSCCFCRKARYGTAPSPRTGHLISFSKHAQVLTCFVEGNII